MNEEMLINRICAGYILHELTNQGTSDGENSLIKLGSPTLDDKYYADYLAEQWYSNCFRAGVWTEEEAIDYMVDNNIWDYDKEIELNKLKDGVQELKVKLFEMRLQSNSANNVRIGIKESRKRINKLEELRSSLFYSTCEFLSRLVRQNYLSMCNIRDLDDKLLVNPKTILGEPNTLFNEILQARIEYLLMEEDFRYLARSDYWHSIWNSSQRLTDLFGVATKDITLEQQHLVIWSHIYDNIREHTECPPEDVINDDDMLDGWMIIQRRKSDGERNKNDIDSKLSRLGAKGQEVYVKVDTESDARKVHAMNDTEASNRIKQRMSLVNKRGIVNEMEMPDTKQRLMMEANNKFRNQIKGQ